MTAVLEEQRDPHDLDAASGRSRRLAEEEQREEDDGQNRDPVMVHPSGTAFAGEIPLRCGEDDDCNPRFGAARGRDVPREVVPPPALPASRLSGAHFRRRHPPMEKKAAHSDLVPLGGGVRGRFGASRGSRQGGNGRLCPDDG